MKDNKDIVGKCCSCGTIIYKWNPKYLVNGNIYCIDCDYKIDKKENEK